MEAREENRPVVASDLTSKDVFDFGKDVGRDSVKQALVWTIASAMAGGLKNFLSQLFKKG